MKNRDFLQINPDFSAPEKPKPKLISAGKPMSR